ncbi:MAG: AEC family transporter [Rhizobiales bacterium]|nr:AEC family transporter [Hyphomicrobiales bacterium]
MIAVIESLLPIFCLIGLGFILRWRNVVAEDMWRGVELLGYWVFFPALLSETLIEADLASLPLAEITFTMALAFATMAGGLLALRLPLMGILDINGASYSSLFQNATRWNGFIALPILDKLYGKEGVALVAIIMAILVPVANIVNVAVIARNAGARQLSYRQTAYVVFRNPFIWATAVGLAINLTGIRIYEPVMTGLHMLGGAAIGTGLLMVGAGLHAEEARRPSPVVWLGTGLKLLGMPIIVFIWILLFGISGPAVVACLICAGVPTAMSAYVLARQMGGDATLVATTVTVQTLLSVITIPLLIVFAETVK